MKPLSKSLFYTLVILDCICLILSCLNANIVMGMFALAFSLYLKKLSKDIPLPHQFQKIIQKK